LHDLETLLSAAASGEQRLDQHGHLRLRPGTHHLALTGLAGIGKSALAFEVVRRNRGKFLGSIIGILLQDGKSFGDALAEMIHHLHISTKVTLATDLKYCERLVLGTLRALASRELPCLLLLDAFEEVKGQAELDAWLHFLSSVPSEVVVLVTSHSSPETMMALEGPRCRWYEYRVGKMTDADLLDLSQELASASGLDQRIHLDDVGQQAILHEVSMLLDGYPLGAELIFGTARLIDGKIYMPEAATRSLEEVRDELSRIPLAGIRAVLEVSYRRLTPSARLLLAYLAALEFPFGHEQIIMLLAPEALTNVNPSVQLVLEQDLYDAQYREEKVLEGIDESLAVTLAENWRAARDELVHASFLQFDGRVYSIHRQIRHFALAYLPTEERRRIQRVVAGYDC